LPAAARRVFANGGGGAPTDFDRRRLRHWKTGGGGVTGQLMLMLYLNHTNEQEQKSEKSS